MEAALSKVGFRVSKYHDLARNGMIKALRDFRDSLGSEDTAFFYFSGHGVSIGGANFVIPTKMANGLRTADDYNDEAVSDMRISVMITESGCKFKIIVTDACRNRPGDRLAVENIKAFGAAPKMTFVAMQKSDLARNTYVMHSSGEGCFSYAGQGSDSLSVFTKQLVPLIKEPGLELQKLGKKLQKLVRESSAANDGDKMIIEKTDKMEDDFYFVPGSALSQSDSGLQTSLLRQLTAQRAALAAAEQRASQSNTGLAAASERDSVLRRQLAAAERRADAAETRVTTSTRTNSGEYPAMLQAQLYVVYHGGGCVLMCDPSTGRDVSWPISCNLTIYSTPYLTTRTTSTIGHRAERPPVTASTPAQCYPRNRR